MRDDETIFTEALRLGSVQERSAFLDRACGADAALRGEVEGLLLAHDRAAGGAFLEAPPAQVNIETITADADEHVGSTIGPYKLLEQIGEGGMGVVYMAEQHSPVRRRVALKIIKPGLDSKQVIARLEAERQALAMMDHPNIAKVFDAGATDTGRPYFVMELVRGIPITDYCDQNQLTPRQRLELFVQVCQAVQHAHQKGIIHRDLKPNNVLVTLNDGKPTPKVIDFGIAKATAGQRLTERTMFTEFRQLIGTPLYMSPEQAEMSAVLDVDTRSDVYSLGVLLYELLTGTTPFDKERLSKAAYDEVRRIIREEDPPTPSTRLSTLGQTITAISTHRGTDPKRLGQVVRGELDWIVMRALEKDRTRRYETASAFSQDLERYLADQPVEACPPSRIYRVRKAIRRNRVALTMAALIAIVLMLATAVSSWEAVRARRAKTEAFAEKERADHAATTATKVAQYLTNMLWTANPGARRGRNYTVRQMLYDESERMEQELVGKPEAEEQLQWAICWTFRQLGDGDRAVAHARRMLELRRRIYGERHEAYAAGLDRYARCVGIQLQSKTQESEAEPLRREALRALRQAVGILQSLGISDYRMARVMETMRSCADFTERRELTTQIVAIYAKSSDPTLRARMTDTLAQQMLENGDYAGAAAQFRQRLEVQPRADNMDLRWLRLHLAEALCGDGRYAQSLAEAQRAMALFSKDEPADHWIIQKCVFQITQTLRSARESHLLATTFPSLDKLAEIEQLYRRAAAEAAAAAQAEFSAPIAGIQATRPATQPNTRLPRTVEAAQEGLAELVEDYLALEQQAAGEGNAARADAANFRAAKLLVSLQTELTDANADFLISVYPSLVTALHDANDPSGTDALRRRLLHLTSMNSRICNDAAWQLATASDPARRDPELALHLAEQAVAADPNDGACWNTLGISQYRAGLFQESIRSLLESGRLHQDRTFSWDAFFLAMAHWQLGTRPMPATGTIKPPPGWTRTSRATPSWSVSAPRPRC